MKEGLRKFLIVFILVIFVGYLLVTGIGDLINKKDVYTVRLDECVEALAIEHSINGLIPVGTDHYYVGVNDETGEACYIKASKGWYKKNFDGNGYSNTSGGLTITSLAKKASDYEVEKELVARAEQLEGLDFTIPANYSLELDYKFNAICKLALLVIAGILAFVGVKIVRNNGNIKSGAGKAYLVACVIFLILLLKVIL